MVTMYGKVHALRAGPSICETQTQVYCTCTWFQSNYRPVGWCKANVRQQRIAPRSVLYFQMDVPWCLVEHVAEGKGSMKDLNGIPVGDTDFDKTVTAELRAAQVSFCIYILVYCKANFEPSFATRLIHVCDLSRCV